MEWYGNISDCVIPNIKVNKHESWVAIPSNARVALAMRLFILSSRKSKNTPGVLLSKHWLNPKPKKWTLPLYTFWQTRFLKFLSIKNAAAQGKASSGLLAQTLHDLTSCKFSRLQMHVCWKAAEQLLKQDLCDCLRFEKHLPTCPHWCNR